MFHVPNTYDAITKRKIQFLHNMLSTNALCKICSEYAKKRNCKDSYLL